MLVSLCVVRVAFRADVQQSQGENLSGAAASAKANPQDSAANRTEIPKDRQV